MQNKYRRKTLKALLVLLVVFALAFAASFYALKKGFVLVPFGLPMNLENWIVMVFSILAMMRVFAEIMRVEKAF